MLARALAPSPLVHDSLIFRKVHLVQLKTGQTTNLNNPGKMGQLAWSPNGKKLALISGKDKHDPMQGRLWVRAVDEPAWSDALPLFMGHVESIAWKNDGTLLYQAS